MKRVFISYASKDRPTAKAIHAHLGLSYDVFLDQHELYAGTNWEDGLRRSLEQTDVVVALVSPDSVASVWVTRELAYAEQLGKPCVPALLSGHPPLRLIHLQYVDFRGTFEPALAELMLSLAKLAEPVTRSVHEATVMLGSAVRARLSGDEGTANTFVSRAATLDRTLAVFAPTDLWRELGTPRRMALDPRDIRTAQIVERTDVLADSPYEDRLAHRWSIHIEGAPGLLDAIAEVEYCLHPTFRPPRQVVRSRADGFCLSMIGWGRFEILVRPKLVDGSTLETSYMLTFAPTASQPVVLRKA